MIWYQLKLLRKNLKKKTVTKKNSFFLHLLFAKKKNSNMDKKSNLKCIRTSILNNNTFQMMPSLRSLFSLPKISNHKKKTFEKKKPHSNYLKIKRVQVRWKVSWLAAIHHSYRPRIILKKKKIARKNWNLDFFWFEALFIFFFNTFWNCKCHLDPDLLTFSK